MRTSRTKKNKKKTTRPKKVLVSCAAANTFERMPPPPLSRTLLQLLLLLLLPVTCCDAADVHNSFSLSRTHGILHNDSVRHAHGGAHKVGVCKVRTRTLRGRTDGSGGLSLEMMNMLTATEVLVGSQRTRMKVIVDTGSSTLALPSDMCRGCSTRVGAVYESQKSTTLVPVPCLSPECKNSRPECGGDDGCFFQVRYADSSGEAGDIVRDTVAWGPHTTATLLGRIFAQIPLDGFSSSGVDGILGLGGRGLNFGSAPTLLDDIIAAESLEDKFAMQIGVQGVEGSGVVDIGAAAGDPSRFVGQMQWTAMDPELWYVVKPEALSVGGFIVAAAESDFGESTIVDSGSSLILLPAKLYRRVRAVFEAKFSHLVGVGPVGGTDTSMFTPNSCFTNLPIDQFPVLKIRFRGGAVASLPPSSYFLKAALNGETYHCFGIAAGDMNEGWQVPASQSILGDSFMSGLYVVFDRAGKRLGFANTRAAQAALDRAPHTTAGADELGVPFHGREESGLALGVTTVLLVAAATLACLLLRRCASGSDAGYREVNSTLHSPAPSVSPGVSPSVRFGERVVCVDRAVEPRRSQYGSV